MKVVHIVSFINSGAGRAAERINEALLSMGIDSSVYTLFDEKSPHVHKIANLKMVDYWLHIQNAVNLIIPKFLDTKDYWSCDYFGTDITKNKDIMSADVIHLHWVNEGCITYNSLNNLASSGKKIIWTLHDMYPFTGGCHYAGDCLNYESGCGNCPILQANKSQRFSKIAINNKRNAAQVMNLTVCGCSKWITNCASKSFVFKKNTCINVPNCIDTKLFYPVDKDLARKALGIAVDKKVILFGAVSSISDKRKGFLYLKEALKNLPQDKFKCCIFGTNSCEPLAIESQALGYITDERKLALIYSAADVFVAPSIQENLANTVVEALACGTPVVAFNVGGMPDMVITGKTGYLAQYCDVVDFSTGIKFCTDHDLRNQCRQYALDNYDYIVGANNYIRIYMN